MHRCKLNLPASSAGGVAAAQAQIPYQSLTAHRGDKGNEERALSMKGSMCVHMGTIFLNTVWWQILAHIQKQVFQI